MFKVGTAIRVINNEIGSAIQGAGTDRVVEWIRDDLEANFFYLTDGTTELLLINCDVGGLAPRRVRNICRRIARATGVPERNAIVTCTHTHAGPSVLDTSPVKEVDTAWYRRLGKWLVNGAEEAKAGATSVRVGYGKGMARIGHNRRACWADGTHSMYRPAGRSGFTGVEGPHDASHFVLFAEDRKGRLRAVIHNNSCHAVSFYGANFHSADYPGQARADLRDAYGDDLAVLYLNGGIGDSCAANLLKPGIGRESREVRCKRLGHIVAGETMRLIEDAETMASGPLRHAWTDLKVGLRRPDGKKLPGSKERVERLRREGSFAAIPDVPKMSLILDYGRVRLDETFGRRKNDTLALHALRVGEAALVTNPCELYSQFMIDVRRRSPTPYTMFADISDGYNGYCPTIPAIRAGGYSGEAILWTRLAPEAGYAIVEELARLLAELWG